MPQLKNKTILALISCLLLFLNCNTGKKDSQNKDNSHFQKAYTDKEILDSVQKQTINYFWEGAEPNSGLARERLHMDDIYPTSPKNTVTTGGSGFGLMAMLVGIV
jgi:hypothetical protein